MASNFKQEKDEIVGAYTDALIQHVCQVEVGTKNYRLAQEFVSSNLESHKFLDTSTQQVERSKFAAKFIICGKNLEGNVIGL